MTEQQDDRARRAAEARERVRHLAPAEALDGSRVVVDVREPEEYATDHVEGAVNVPLEELEHRAAEVLGEHGTPVVTYCNGGGRGSLAADTLARLGWTDVANLEGGLRGMR